MLIVLGAFRCRGNDVRRCCESSHTAVGARAPCAALQAKEKLKKRHVEVVTRLPTNRMAPAGWAFIVAKSTLLRPRRCLISRRCGPPTSKTIHNLSTNACGRLGDSFEVFDSLR